MSDVNSLPVVRRLHKLTQSLQAKAGGATWGLTSENQALNMTCVLLYETN